MLALVLSQRRIALSCLSLRRSLDGMGGEKDTFWRRGLGTGLI